MRYSLLCVLVCLGCGPSTSPAEDTSPDVTPDMTNVPDMADTTDMETASDMMEDADAPRDMETEDMGGPWVSRTWPMRERTETTLTLELQEVQDDLATNTRTLVLYGFHRDFAWGPAYVPRHTIKLGSIIDPLCGPNPMPVQWLGEEEATEFPNAQTLRLDRTGRLEVTLPNAPSPECTARYETELTLQANVTGLMWAHEIQKIDFNFHKPCAPDPEQPSRILPGSNFTPRLIDTFDQPFSAANVDPLAPIDLTLRAQKELGASEVEGLEAWLTPSVAQRLEVEDGLGIKHTFEVLDPETPLSYAPPLLYWPGTASNATIHDGSPKEQWGRDAPYLAANVSHMQTEQGPVCVSRSEASVIAPPQVALTSQTPEVCEAIERITVEGGGLQFRHTKLDSDLLNTDLTRWPAPSTDWLHHKTQGECRATLQIRSPRFGDEDLEIFIDVVSTPPSF